MKQEQSLEFLTNDEFIKIVQRRKALFGFHHDIAAEYGSKYLGSGDGKHYILKDKP